MSKSKAAKRRNNAANETQNKKIKVTGPPTPPLEDGHPLSISELVSQEELEITVETLQTLARNPTMLKSKACRDVRVAVYDVKNACTVGALASATDTNLTARISAALTDENYTDALILLAEMRIRGDSPKLGALCRWVRDLDVVSGLSMNSGGVSHAPLPRSARDKTLLKVLDSILRVTGFEDMTNTTSLPDGDDAICLQPAWDTSSSKIPSTTPFSDCDHNIAASFKLIETTPGPARKPPNLHPALLFLSDANTIPLPPPSHPITKHMHPAIPDLFLLSNVLSPQECHTITTACTAVGFTPDAPILSSSNPLAASILAHNVYWLIDQPFHDALFERVRQHLPAHVAAKALRGLNRRFRVYRYVPGAEYRCHIDGAWPPSGTTTSSSTTTSASDGSISTPTYLYDASPATARQSSLFTFLLYLNDDFSSGSTTFFVPSRAHGVLSAYPVKPVAGSVAVFPHGEASGALLHEGTGVAEGGVKYIIRTDVEYDVDPTEEVLPKVTPESDAIEEDK